MEKTIEDSCKCIEESAKTILEETKALHAKQEPLVDINTDEKTLITLMLNVVEHAIADKKYKSSAWLDPKKGILCEKFKSIDLSKISDCVFNLCGFFVWDENTNIEYKLIPLWVLDYIPIGTELISINGDKVKLDKDIRIDTRFGCIPYLLKVR